MTRPPTKIYRGQRNADGVCTVTVNDRPLPLRLDLANKSPTGFEWGYCGSGPAQLALAILADATEWPPLALAWFQRFKRDRIAAFGDKWILTLEQVFVWLVDAALDEAADGEDPFPTPPASDATIRGWMERAMRVRQSLDDERWTLNGEKPSSTIPGIAGPDAAPVPLTAPAGATVRACRVCGCTDLNCQRCLDLTGYPCWWVEADLCSACVDSPVMTGAVGPPSNRAPMAQEGDEGKTTVGQGDGPDNAPEAILGAKNVVEGGTP